MTLAATSTNGLGSIEPLVKTCELATAFWGSPDLDWSSAREPVDWQPRTRLKPKIIAASLEILILKV
jgi:hypothetical protein